jgi:hypothetical protein
VPVHRLLGIERVADGPANAVHAAIEGYAGDGAAGARQRRDGAPSAGPQVEGEALAVRPAVLLDETADGVKHAVEHGDADMIGALRQRRRLDPRIAPRVIDLVIGSVNPLRAVADDEMHLVIMRHRPRHLATREQQWCLGDPSSLIGGVRCRAF